MREDDILEIARLLRLTGRETERIMNNNAANLGLTSSRADALVFIVRNEGCSISDLSRSMKITHQAACGIADRMKKSGLIDAVAGEEDGRVRILRPTEDGRALYEKFVSTGIDVNTDMLSGFSDAEIKSLLIALRRVASKLVSGI